MSARRLSAEELKIALSSVPPSEPLGMLADHVEALEAERGALIDRLVERANEEPPSGWLCPGEDGYERTPEGALARANAAETDRDRLRAEVERLRTLYRLVDDHNCCEGADAVHTRECRKLLEEIRVALEGKT